ncbi:hypothetical protein PUNSTDRAFT_128318 [Punctularia strigosozonata HHB-11173 SS5]|uniref:Uncharacterized protein n=1 Tax=Punctularia strigosozonata (strain HHB-11173) TaxID=741275 RepID=R7S3V1_PUNST|nr:uncharacterized protein PUNSTDRAFT_128318 [Punctularia strigosozonata HHB-11173 SS5]EIN04477.1 hypothetical protein PUNSTDRAFT_128318 [Punctularia strigosozonata HHB-11173 SS5]
MSSPSSTPRLLTPDTTGSTSSDPSTLGVTTPDKALKKSRRQTAFYPNMKSSSGTKQLKPFSRSAAKRESVMALGSIEHLQHYFTKTGLSAPTNPLEKKNLGLVPALGGIVSGINTGLALPTSHSGLALPPTPVVPTIVPPPFEHHVRSVETDPETLKPGVIDDLASIAHTWGLSSTAPTTSSSAPGSPAHFDVLAALKLTTQGIRAVRNYVLALPSDTVVALRDEFRSRVTASAPALKRQTSRDTAERDPLALVRRAALDLLAVLRELEEKARLPLSDDAYDASSDHEPSSSSQGGHSRVASPASHSIEIEPPEFTGSEYDPELSFSLVKVKGRHEHVPVWEEETYEINSTLSPEEREKREGWEERLVLGGGWLYKQDVALEQLGREKDAVRKYLDDVDDVLFGGSRDGSRGWERERKKIEKEREARRASRRASAGDGDGFGFPKQKRQASVGRRVVSTGMLDAMREMTVSEEPEEIDQGSDGLHSLVEEEEIVEDEDLPDWAKRSTFGDDPMSRLQAVLRALTPVPLQAALPPTDSDRLTILTSLASGQLLCEAYNVGVRRSRKPWGFISKHGIHDLLTLEQEKGGGEEEKEKRKKGWTFRRVDNLRLWAAALKLRYMLPIVTPPTASGTVQPSSNLPTPVTSPSPAATRFPAHAQEAPIHFDALLVAKKDTGWDAMLETAVMRWMAAVVDEKRGER